MRALIVGAAGFVGGYLIEALQTEKYEITATKLKHEKINAEVKAVDLDLSDFSAVCGLLEETKPNVIFHLAAQSSVKISWDKPQLTANVNIIGAINLFEAVRVHCPDAKVIVIGSSEEYGDIDYNSAVKEAVTPEPKNIYALTKYAQEKLAKIYVDAYGLHFVMTRSFNHIGSGQSAQFVVADFCSQVARIERGEQEPVIKVGNLNSFRDFSDVRDVVRAYILLAKKGVDGEVYNVGNGNSIKISDILETVISLSETKIEVVVDKQKFRPIDVPRIQADISKMRGLGWEPSIPIKQSVSETLDFYRGL